MEGALLSLGEGSLISLLEIRTNRAECNHHVRFPGIKAVGALVAGRRKVELPAKVRAHNYVSKAV